MAQLREVSLTRGGRRVLHRVSLDAPAGRVTAIAGPNGSGKTTALALLAGDLTPQAGEVRLGGEPMARLSPAERARRRAVMPQHFEIAFDFTAREVVEMGLLPDAPPAAARGLVARALEEAGLGPLADRAVTRLSGGERQRVAFARALAQIHSAEAAGAAGPRTLLLDEPTASLDLAHQALMIAALRRLAGRGVGVAVVLHDLNLAAAADAIVLLKDGEVAAHGPPEAVLTEARIASVYAAPVRLVEHEGRRLVALVPPGG